MAARAAGELLGGEVAGDPAIATPESTRADRTLYRRVFEHSLDAMLLTTSEGEIVAANPEACRLFGRTEDELRHLGRAAIIDPHDPGQVAALAERDRTGRFAGVLTFRRADDTRFDAEIRSTIFSAPEGGQYASVVVRGVGAERAPRPSAEQLAASRLEGVTLTARELAHRLGNNFAMVRVVFELLQHSPAVTSALGDFVRQATARVDVAAQDLAKLERVVRVETRETPMGPALDLERSV